MTFLNPLMLWGLLGVSIPVLIHLLNLYRFRRTDWAAMRFLARAAQVRSRQLRLRDILLMLLRCLAVLLVVLALSRPIWRPGRPVPVGESRAGVVIAVDGSYSMMHEATERSRFDRALDRVRQIAATVGEGDPASLVLLGTPNRIVLRNVPFQAERFAEAIDGLSPLAEPANLEALPGAIRPLIDEMKVADKEVYVVTDVQSRDWNALSAESREGFRGLAQETELRLVPVRAESSENLAVTDLHLASGVLRRDSLARYSVKVRNCGRRERKQIGLTCKVNGVGVNEATIPRLEPGQTESVSLYARLGTAGRTRITAELKGGDELALDNELREVAHVREQLRVLCVDGNPLARRWRGAADFLVAALTGPRSGSTTAPLEVTRIPWTALSSTHFEQYDVVMLADVPEIPEGLVPGLYDYVRGGGGLVVFAGRNTRPEVWNRHLGGPSADMLPAELEAISEEPFTTRESRPLDTALTDHMLCQTLRGLSSDQLGSIRFEQYVRLRPVADARVALRLAPGAEPLMVERRVGRGRVVLFASTANRDWHNMVLNPAFAMLLHQTVSYVTRHELEIPVEVGQPIVVPLDDMDVDDDVTFIEPGGRTVNTKTVERQGRTIGVFERTEEVGFHRVQCEVATPAFLVAVNPATEESDVEALDADQREELAREMGMEVLAQEGSLEPTIRSKRLGRELWMPLVILALAAAIGESLLARRITGRKTHTTETGT